MRNVPQTLLDSLRELAKPSDDFHRTAKWLKSAFTDRVWKMQFGDFECSVDWNINLDGDLLTSKRHAKLVDIFRTWATIQTHPLVTGGRELDDTSAYNSVSRAFRQMDYMLLHADKWGIPKYGFRATTENDVYNMLYAIERHAEDDYSIYAWNERLAGYFRVETPRLQDSDLVVLRRDVPELFEIELPEEEWSLDLTREQLILARALVWMKGIYKSDRDFGYRYTPRTNLLAEEVYKDTLWGKSRKPIIEELCIERMERYIREYRGVDVRTAVGDTCSERRFERHRTTLLSLGILADLGLEVPVAALKAAATTNLVANGKNLKPAGRYRTPPFWQVMDSFRCGVEFVLKHGEHLVDSYVSAVKAAAEEKVSVAKLLIKKDLRQFLSPETLKMGVQVWSLSKSSVLPLGYPTRDRASQAGRLTNKEYFAAMRQNKGLIEMERVLFGAIEHNIGALMGRRQGELGDLPLVGCLDESRRYLVFKNRKSGALGVRQEEIRPIPSICVEMIELVERLQTGLILAGTLEKPTFLFSVPGWSGRLIHNHIAYNGALDTFCDYFETPLTDEGLRHYIRQHQLRRFFAIAFFYGAAYANLETLRWFLGHTDIEHLWHYITESIPGEMLRSVQANFVVHGLQKHSCGGDAMHMEMHMDVHAQLSELALKEFGTKNFSLIDSEALEGYLMLLINKGLSVEPVFFTTPNGKRHRIIVTVKKGVKL